MTRISLPMWLATLLLSGCGGCGTNKTDEGRDTVGEDGIDDDGDGFDRSEDCDDDNDDVYPGADEICDGVDNDCDDLVDDDDPGVEEGDQHTWYTDQDDDGYGTDDSAILACDQPYGNSVLLGGDCDDDDVAVNPGELEYCNGKDDDCDGTTDINAVDGYDVYADTDQDNYGDEGSSLKVCEDTGGYTETGGDCDDENDDVNPGEDESCFNEIDDNCDGEIDDSCPIKVCGDITEDTVWTDETFGYYVSCDVAVLAELTIEPGTLVYFGPDVGMTVGLEGEGALIVDAADDPVTFTSGISVVYPSIAPAEGDWRGLEIGSLTDQYTTVLDGLSVWYGGGEDSDGGVVMSDIDLPFTSGEVCASGTDGLSVLDGTSVHVQDVLLCDNLGHGLYADNNSGPSSIEDSVFSGNQEYPISVLASYGGAIASSNSFDSHATAVSYIELRGTTIGVDLTLASQEYSYAITSDVSVYGAAAPMLTLDDGVTLAFAAEAGLQIGASTSAGDWTALGSEVGVLLTAMDSSRGWDGVTAQQGSDVLDLSGVTFEYGGNNRYGNLYLVNGSAGLTATIEDSKFLSSFSNGLYVGPSLEPLITGATFADNAGYGLYIDDDGGLYVGTSASFAGNEFSGNEAPISVPAAYLDQLDDSSTYSESGDELIEVTGATVTRTGTWQCLDADYWVLGDIVVDDSDSPVVTINAGCTFYMDPDTEITVGNLEGGGFNTVGTTTTPVTFTSATDGARAGDWDGITLDSDTLDSSALTGIVVEYAGGNGSGGILIDDADPTIEDCRVSNSSNSGIYVDGDSEPTISGCTVEYSDEYGVYVASGAGLAEFSSNTVTNSGSYPVGINVNYASVLTSDSSFSENDLPYVEIVGGTLSTDSSWYALDVPYLRASSLTVSADLTLRAGVDMVFSGASSGLVIGTASRAGLTVSGTSAAHVTMGAYGDDPGPGDWSGIKFNSRCDASTIRYLDVTNADYGLYVDCSSAVTVSNSSFTDSATYDVYCSSRVSSTSLVFTSVTYDTASPLCDL